MKLVQFVSVSIIMTFKISFTQKKTSAICLLFIKTTNEQELDHPLQRKQVKS